MDALSDEGTLCGVLTLPCSLTSSRSSAGLRPANNGFFILKPEEIEERGLPAEVLSAHSPQPAVLTGGRNQSRCCAGNPVLEHRSFLLDCRLPEETVKERYPTLDALFRRRQGARHRRPLSVPASIALVHARAPPGRPIFMHLSRQKRQKRRATPFRFILNHSEATRLQCLSDAVSAEES